jgi:membrane-bound lytic murein transglycosylase MltF
MGLDPNRWFYNMEVVAAQEIGRETVQYVGNIFKYYIVYRSVFSQLEKKEQLRKKNAGSK